MPPAPPLGQAKFKEDGSVQLQNFLNKTWSLRLAAATAAADASDALGGGRTPAYGAGMGGGWVAVGPTHKQRYLRYEGSSAAAEDDPPAARAGAALQQLRTELFASPAFARLLHQVHALPHPGGTPRLAAKAVASCRLRALRLSMAAA